MDARTLAELARIQFVIDDLSGSRLGAAVGNALPSVKEAADRIAPTHDEDGLVEVVRWLLH